MKKNILLILIGLGFSLISLAENLIPEMDDHDFNNSTSPKGVIDLILDVSSSSGKVWTLGEWTKSTSIPGYIGSYYLYATQDKSTKSIMTWYFTIPKEGYYDIYEHHTAYFNRTNRAKLKISDGDSKSAIMTTSAEVDQTGSNKTWVKVATIWARNSGNVTVTMSNDISPTATGTSINSGVVIADAMRLQHVSGKKYQVTSTEGSNISMTCPVGKTPDLIVGHYYDPNNKSKRCVFYSQNTGGGNSFLLGNYLCGDPSWGNQKAATLEYRCVEP